MSFSSGGLADSCLQEDFSEAGSISPSSSDLIPDRSHGADALQVWGFLAGIWAYRDSWWWSLVIVRVSLVAV